MSDEYVTDIEEEIGQVTHYSDMKQYGGKFSNTYQEGTKYYAIKGVEQKKAIAVQQVDGTYKKAYSNGEYEGKSRDSYLLFPAGFAMLFAMIIGTIFIRTREKT